MSQHAFLSSGGLSTIDELQDYLDENTNFLNPNAAEALANVAGAESGGNASVVNSVGATGLFQDLFPSRLQGLKSFLSSNNLPLSSIDGQAQYAINELGSGSFGPTVAALNNPNLSLSELENVIISNFENPGTTPSSGNGILSGEQIDQQNVALVNQQVDGGNQAAQLNQGTGTVSITDGSASVQDASGLGGNIATGGNGGTGTIGIAGDGGSQLGAVNASNGDALSDGFGSNALGLNSAPVAGNDNGFGTVGGLGDTPSGNNLGFGSVETPGANNDNIAMSLTQGTTPGDTGSIQGVNFADSPNTTSGFTDTSIAGSANSINDVSGASQFSNPEGSDTNIATTNVGQSVATGDVATTNQGVTNQVVAAGQDVPSAINAQTTGAAQDTASQTKTAAADTASTNKTAAAVAKTAAQTALAQTASNQSFFANFFTRAAFILTGMIMLGVGLYYLAPKAVTAPVRAAGKAAAFI